MIKQLENEKIEEQNLYMEKVKSLSTGLKYFINTMGCKLNENDSEKMAGMLEKMGYPEYTTVAVDSFAVEGGEPVGVHYHILALYHS